MCAQSTTESQLDWLVMLYVAVDDKESPTSRAGTLTDQCHKMLERLKTSLQDNVAVVALTDSPYDDKDNKYTYMTPAIRELTEGEWSLINLSADQVGVFFLNEPQTRQLNDVAQSGELVAPLSPNDSRPPEERKMNSGNYVTLKEFINLSLSKHCAKHTMLAIIGHGGGWSPSFPTTEPSLTLEALKDGGNHSPSISGLCPDYSARTEDIPYTAISTVGLGVAIESGLENRRKQDSQFKLDVLFLDVCLMGMIEVAYEVQDYAKYLIAGEDLMYASLPYDLYLQGIQNKQPINVATSIVELYNSGRTAQKTYAIAAIDLEKISDIRRNINLMADALLQSISCNTLMQFVVATAYQKSQKFDYDADMVINVEREGYADLLDFVNQLCMLLENDNFYKDDKNLLDCVENIRYYAQGIKNIIGDGYRISKPKKGNIAHVLEKQYSSRERAHAVLCSRAQTEKRSRRVLNRAHGLSIYLPIGEQDERHKHDRKIENLFEGKTYLDFYVEQLKFTGEEKDDNRTKSAWAQLVEKLVETLFPSDVQGRDLNQQPYSPPQHIPLDDTV